MSIDVARYVRNCHVCQRSHSPRDKALGLLWPLPVLDRPWQHVTMDFNSFSRDKHGFDAVYVVIDRLSKQGISILCFYTTTAEDMARLYITYVYHYVGLPVSIVSNRGLQFISAFWTKFYQILQVQLKLLTTNYL